MFKIVLITFIILTNSYASCVVVPCTQAVETWYLKADKKGNKKSNKVKDELKELKSNVKKYNNNLKALNKSDYKKVQLLIKRAALLSSIYDETLKLKKQLKFKKVTND